ncbi:prealbumin-like fold domain-containing protein [Olsenella uli]|nr:prealbumin-like fold domain-containing protein [Olsenella uli]
MRRPGSEHYLSERPWPSRLNVLIGLYTTSEAAEAATAANPGTGTNTFVGTVITNEQGKASFEDLGEGTYYLKELAAPGAISSTARFILSI